METIVNDVRGTSVQVRGPATGSGFTLNRLLREPAFIAAAILMLVLTALVCWPFISGPVSTELYEEVFATRGADLAALRVMEPSTVVSSWERKNKAVEPMPDKIRLPGDEGYGAAPAQQAAEGPAGQRQELQDSTSFVQSGDETPLAGDFSEFANPDRISLGMGFDGQGGPVNGSSASQSIGKRAGGPITERPAPGLLAKARPQAQRRLSGVLGGYPLRDAVRSLPSKMTPAAFGPEALRGEPGARVAAGGALIAQATDGGRGMGGPLGDAQDPRITGGGRPVGGGGGNGVGDDRAKPLSRAELQQLSAAILQAANDYHAQAVSNALALETQQASRLKQNADRSLSNALGVQGTLAGNRGRWPLHGGAIIEEAYQGVTNELLPRLQDVSSQVGSAQSGLPVPGGCQGSASGYAGQLSARAALAGTLPKAKNAKEIAGQIVGQAPGQFQLAGMQLLYLFGEDALILVVMLNNICAAIQNGIGAAADLLPGNVDAAPVQNGAAAGYGTVQDIAAAVKGVQDRMPPEPAAMDIGMAMDSALLASGSAVTSSASAGSDMSSLVGTGEQAVTAYASLCEAQALADTLAQAAER